MANVDLYSSSVAAANPATPPSGWELTAGSNGGVRVGGVLQSFFDDNNSYSGWSSTALPTRVGNTIHTRVYMGASSNFDSAFFCVTLLDSAGEGYVFEIQPYSYKLFKVPSGSIAGGRTQIASVGGASPPLNTDYFDINYNVSTGLLTGALNGSTVISATDTEYSENLMRCGFALKGYVNQSGISRVTAFDVLVISITSINGGNPITAGQVGIPVSATGFSAKPTGVTATYSGGSLTATIGAGTATDFVINLQDRVDSEDWPLNGSVVTFTFTYGAESAQITQTVVKKSNETAYTFSGVITDDLSSIGYHLVADGFTAEGGEHVYKQPPATGTMPVPDLVLSAEGGWTVSEPCTFESWFRPATGTGAGNVYSYTWTISEAGIAVVSRGQMPSLAIGYGIGI